MKIRRMANCAFATIICATASVSAAQAAVYEFSYNDGTNTSSGDLTATGTGSPLTMVGITGNFDGISITGVAPLSTCCSSPPNDNFVYTSGPYLDLDGMAFDLKSGVSVNIYSVGSSYYELTTAGGQGGPGTFTLTAVPELSTWTMMLAGFAGLGFFDFRRNKATSIAA